jgi:parallel beta-helix repeat protein
LVVAAALMGQRLSATTVVVGPSTCKPAYVHFSTIQSAVNASPFGTIIMVCPGTYAEQVVINQPLTLEGVTDGTGNAAVIAVPAGGLIVNATSVEFGPVTAQLLVENTVGVTVSDLIVDGTGGTCVAGANRTVGIEFYNVGTAVDGTTAGKIQNVVVRNQTNACGTGEGILSDTSFITVNANELHDIDRTGILADSAKNTITNNSVQHSHNYGIVLDNQGASLVSGNTISDATLAGILAGFVALGSVSNATITKNTVVNGGTFGIGIWLFDAFYSAVNHNQVSNAAWPMVLQFAFFDTVQTNVFNEASIDGILDQNSFGGNIVTKNTVNEAAFGIFTDSSVGGDTIVPNSLFNVVVTVDPNPADAPPAPSQF